MERKSKSMIKVITIEGASKSSTDKSQLVSTMVGKTVGYVSKSIDSLSCKEKVFEDIYGAAIKGGPILFVAKSLGAIRLCQYFRHIRYVSGIAPWKAVIIDPHAPFPLLYGPFRPFNFRVDLSSDIENFYQRNKYPRGAIVKGANNTHVDGDHFTIVNHPLVLDSIERSYSKLVDIEPFLEVKKFSYMSIGK